MSLLNPQGPEMLRAYCDEINGSLKNLADSSNELLTAFNGLQEHLANTEDLFIQMKSITGFIENNTENIKTLRKVIEDKAIEIEEFLK